MSCGGGGGGILNSSNVKTVLSPVFEHITHFIITNLEIKNKVKRLLTVSVLCSFPLWFGYNFKNIERLILP
jgi:hypothetical protein